MRVWRIASRRHSALDGEGSRLFGGRWTPPGKAAVYTSQSLSLAALERLVHTDPDLPGADLVAIAIDVPADVAVHEVLAVNLPAGWRTFPAPEYLTTFGLAWLAAGVVAALRVPSAVVPAESNILLNPTHSDFARVSVAGMEPFGFDPRLLGGGR